MTVMTQVLVFVPVRFAIELVASPAESTVGEASYIATSRAWLRRSSATMSTQQYAWCGVHARRSIPELRVTSTVLMGVSTQVLLFVQVHFAIEPVASRADLTVGEASYIATSPASLRMSSATMTTQHYAWCDVHVRCSIREMRLLGSFW